jgi:hypothetical protein
MMLGEIAVAYSGDHKALNALCGRNAICDVSARITFSNRCAKDTPHNLHNSHSLIKLIQCAVKRLMTFLQNVRHVNSLKGSRPLELV